MVERQPTEEDIANIAWNKAAGGEGLTPLESMAILNVRGVLIEPTMSEVEPVPVEDSSRPTTMTSEVADEARHVLSHRKVQDLVTGDNVINIPVVEPTPSDNVRITPEQINGLSTYYKNNRSTDIRLIVAELDRVLLPGFAHVLTREERGQLANASPDLIRKIHHETMRMFMADRTNVIIAKLSRGMERHVVPLLDRVSNPQARASIEACVDTWQANASNPCVNFYERTARSAHNNPAVHAEYKLPLARLDSRFFSVGIIEGAIMPANVGAAYSGLTRVMFLKEPPPDQEMDFLDTLAAVHELTHVKHDAEFAKRHGVDSQAYQQRNEQVPTERMIGVIDEDPEAIGNEVELLMAKIGFGRLKTGHIAEKLGVRWEEKGHIVNQLVQYAAQYFPHGRGNDGSMSKTYIDYIESEYRRLGALIFEHNDEGILVPKI